MAIWRITCSGRLYNTETWANVFHVDSTGTPGTAVFDAFEAAYSTAHSGGGMAWLNPCPGSIAVGIDGVTFEKIAAQAIVSPAPPLERVVSHIGGQNAVGGLPLDVSLCISWRTPFAGRSFRGRTYLPVWHENQNDDTGGTVPHPNTTSVAGVAINAKGLLDAADAAGAPLVVYSRTLSAGQLIESGYIDSSWDTQRRRGKTIPVVRQAFVKT